MNLVVDTSVWSLFLRRKKTDDENPDVQKLRYHLGNQDCIFLIGIILQEILDGIDSDDQFDKLAEYLQPFPMVEPNRNDFIEAARLKTLCRRKGIQAGPSDFLIVSICTQRNYPLLTADQDFYHILKHCSLILL